EGGSAEDIARLAAKVADGDDLTPQQQKNIARIFEAAAGQGKLGKVTEALLGQEKFYAFYEKITDHDAKAKIAPLIAANLPETFQLARIEQCNRAAYEYLDNLVANGHLGPNAKDRTFPCDVLIVPGESPEIGPREPSRTAITENARERLDTAKKDFDDGKAAVIVVTGGCVHPESTRISEALAMRDYLISKGVPENRILVEGLARHTTTNLRNVGRMMVDHGLSRGLVVSDRVPVPLISPSQTDYIGGVLFRSAYQSAYGHDGPGEIRDEDTNMGLSDAQLQGWRDQGKNLGEDNFLGIGDRRKLFFPSPAIVRQPGGALVDPLDP
ncbi:MAG TPA: YdcF family protein, partial [Candidatus Obscuribacterales bacterium]